MIRKKPTAGAGAGESAPNNARLRREIEALSRALSFDSHPRSKSSTRHKPESESIKPAAAAAKRSPQQLSSASSSSSSSSSSSFWGWKPLRALSHIGRRRFDVVFTLHVHSISSLPLPLAAPLAVRWKRNTDPAAVAVSTRALPAIHGVAEFDEVLTYHTSVYAARDVGGAAKYEAKHFLIWATVEDAPSLDFGKHTVDLTRLLPHAPLDKLGADDDGDERRWTTSFRLAGKARGALLKVTFGFSLAGPPGLPRKNSISRQQPTVERSASLDRPTSRSSLRSAEDMKVLHEVLPSLRSEIPNLDNVPNIQFSCGKPALDSLQIGFKPEIEVFHQEDVGTEESKACPLMDSEKGSETPSKELDFMVIEHGIEVREGSNLHDKDKLVGDSRIGVEEANTDVPCNKINGVKKDCSSIDDSEREDLAFENLHELPSLESENVGCLQLEAKDSNLPNFKVSRSEDNGGNTNFDDITENEFLNMIGIPDSPLQLSSENDPESPRERLWKQFKEDALATNSLFGFEMGTESEDDAYGSYDDFELSSLVHEAECELQKATQEMDSKVRAEVLENAETEALMREFGLDEKAFHQSPPCNRGGFSNPVGFPLEEPNELPPLGDGLGPFVQTKDGGFVRSMNPSLFINARNNGNLVMQVSSPVVVPAEMGGGIMEVLQRLASLGMEKLSMQATQLMPLEDITGKTMQQVAWETSLVMEAHQRQEFLQHKHEGESEINHIASSGKKKASFLSLSRKGYKDVDSEYVSLDDLAPLAMDKIEALSIEGLRIQSGMSCEEAPANISAMSMGEISAFEGKEAKNRMSLGLEGAGGLQLLDIKDNGDEIDGLMGLSITLDEWMKLDSGIVDEEDHVSDRTSKILAAHHATSADLIGGWKGDRGGKKSGRRWGLLGNNFTVALLVQLRDPLRNFEPVGTPMLALIQVERVFVPPKPKVYCTVSENGNSEQDDEPESNKTDPIIVEEKKEDEKVPQFQITEVHVAGLKEEPDKKPRDNTIQQQSGSRWLLATGMGKKSKDPFGKSKAAQSRDTLWSISSRARDPGAKWNAPAAQNRLIRNPNIIFSG